MQSVTGWRMVSLIHSHFPLSPSDTQQLHPPHLQPPCSSDGRRVRLHNNGHRCGQRRRTREKETLSALKLVWFGAIFHRRHVWMLSLVWTRYYSLFIQETWGWLGNSARPVKIDPGFICFLSSSLLSYSFSLHCDTVRKKDQACRWLMSTDGIRATG